MSDDLVHAEPFRGYQLEVRFDRGAYWGRATNANNQLETGPRSSQSEALNQGRFEILKRETQATERASCIVDCISGEVLYTNLWAQREGDFPYGERHVMAELEREIVKIGGNLVCKVATPA